MLRKELQDLEKYKQQLAERLAELESGRRAVAVVLTHKCAGCGLCSDVCPSGAICVDRHASVNPWLCSACSVCIQECPNEAIIIARQKIRNTRIVSP